MTDLISHYYYATEIVMYWRLILLASNRFTYLSIDGLFVHITRNNNTCLSFDATPSDLAIVFITKPTTTETGSCRRQYNLKYDCRIYNL